MFISFFFPLFLLSVLSFLPFFSSFPSSLEHIDAHDWNGRNATDHTKYITYSTYFISYRYHSCVCACVCSIVQQNVPTSPPLHPPHRRYPHPPRLRLLPPPRVPYPTRIRPMVRHPRPGTNRLLRLHCLGGDCVFGDVRVDAVSSIVQPFVRTTCPGNTWVECVLCRGHLVVGDLVDMGSSVWSESHP